MPRRSANIEEEAERFAKSETKTGTEETIGRLGADNLLSCGSSLVNLACSGNADGAFLKGRYYIIVGASGAGKTWMTHAIFAESTIHPVFRKYRLIRDIPESGADFDVERFFGRKTASRIEEAWPGRTDEHGNPIPNSRTVEEFYDNVNRKLDEAEQAGTGIIYVLDSMDALGSESFSKSVEENMQAREKGAEVKGSYGDGKAKVNSQRLRDICLRLDVSGSFLFIICQERDAIGALHAGKTFSGGNALLFYACLQLWMKRLSPITAAIGGKARNLGTMTKCQVMKNRLTGQQDRDVVVSYYHSFGMDDLGDMFDYLLAEGHWAGGKTANSKVQEVEFGQFLAKEDFIAWLQKEGGEAELRSIVQNVHSGIQESIRNRVRRISKYE